MKMKNIFSESYKLFLLTILLSVGVFGQNNFDNESKESKLKKAQSVIEKAIKRLGGETYRNVQNSVGEGKLSVLKGGQIVSYSSFTDVIVYPNKERTDLIERGSKTVLANNGDNGWFFDESLDKFSDQNEIQLNNFKQSLRSQYNYLLRGDWKDDAELGYVGKRRASLGKRNYVLKLTFKDGFEVEYEFAADGLPMKTTYTRRNIEKKPIKEENRYAQFILENGVLTPFIVDHFTDDQHSFRVNYNSMVYNHNSITNELFVKPENAKKLTKKLKF